MITVKNLCKAYGKKQVLSHFFHNFPKGEISCIMGPSGCGKTTLLRILMGLETPDSGELLGLAEKRLSAIFQEDRLCRPLTPLVNVRMVNPDLPKAEAENALCALGLADSLHQPVRELSGGMKRRVAIVRALYAEYDLLFADEPFKGLDEETKERVMAFFLEKTRNKTVILVTHDKTEADFIGGNLLTL